MIDDRTPDHRPPRPAERAFDKSSCLARVRSAVLNVLVLDGLGIAISGWGLSRRDQLGPGSAWIDRIAPSNRTGMLVIGGLIFLAYLLIRVGSGRAALKDPAKRGTRFFRSRVFAAGIASIAIPLGFLAGWASDPSLGTLAPYWIAALGMGFLALPRGHEFDDLDEPTSPSIN